MTNLHSSNHYREQEKAAENDQLVRDQIKTFLYTKYGINFFVRAQPIVFYIAGPVSNDNPVIMAENKQKLREAEAWLHEYIPEAKILNPARHPDGLPEVSYMKHCIQDISDSDLVINRPGVENSNGALCEHFFAIKACVPEVKLETLQAFVK